jgi:hypothetical protein
VSFLLTALGLLLLLLSFAGIAIGCFMALDGRTREPGVFFALWWVPAVAASGGLLMGDPVTFSIGAFCFIMAGVAIALERRGSKRPARSGKPNSESIGGLTLFGKVKRRLSGWMKAWEYRKIQ